MIPGGLRQVKNSGRLLSPAGLTFLDNPDHVTLSAYGAEVDLSRTYRAIRDFTPGLERALEDGFAGNEGTSDRTGADLITVVEWRRGPEGEPDGRDVADK